MTPQQEAEKEALSNIKHEIAKSNGLGKTLVTGHLSKYWEEACIRMCQFGYNRAKREFTCPTCQNVNPEFCSNSFHFHAGYQSKLSEYEAKIKELMDNEKILIDQWAKDKTSIKELESLLADKEDKK